MTGVLAKTLLILFKEVLVFANFKIFIENEILLVCLVILSLKIEEISIKNATTWCMRFTIVIARAITVMLYGNNWKHAHFWFSYCHSWNNPLESHINTYLNWKQSQNLLSSSQTNDRSWIWKKTHWNITFYNLIS